MRASQQSPELQKVLDALSSPIRREILWLVWNEELPAGSIAAAFELSAPTISEHLSVLREAGLVDTRSEGTFRFYRARQNVLRGLEAAVIEGGAKWTPHRELTKHEGVTATEARVVHLETVVNCSPADAFRAFVTPAIASVWLGGPATRLGDSFEIHIGDSPTLSGVFEVLSPPDFVSIRCRCLLDGDDSMTPPAFVHFREAKDSTLVQVEQLAGSPRLTDFLSEIWNKVLGAFHRNAVEALS